MAKKTTKKVKKFATLENIKCCPACKKVSVIQNPTDIAKNILECNSCGSRFRLEIIN